MSSEQFLDDLARTMAERMPRRRALRVALGAVVGAAVPGVSARSALSAPTRTAACPPNTDAITYSPCECESTIPGLFAKTCCPNTQYDKYKCVCPGGEMPKAVCTPRSTCPEERRHCGPCCPPGKICNTLLEKCECKKLCGGKCCKPSQTCKQGKCCPNPRACGSICCPTNTKCSFSNGKRTCCPTGRTVTQKKGGRTYRFCCPEGTGIVRGSDVVGNEACCSVGNRNCCTLSDPDAQPLLPLGEVCVDGKRTKL